MEEGIREEIVTPQVIQQRIKSELEFTNARGQKELSIKVIGEVLSFWQLLAHTSDEKFRPLFPYKTFNAMQSVALETVSLNLSLDQMTFFRMLKGRLIGPARTSSSLPLPVLGRRPYSN